MSQHSPEHLAWLSKQPPDCLASVQTVRIPTWAIPDAPCAREGASTLDLAGFEGQWIRLDAKTQRKLFGYPVFGRYAIMSDGQDVHVARSICYGQLPPETDTYSWDQVSRAVQAKCLVGRGK